VGLLDGLSSCRSQLSYTTRTLLGTAAPEYYPRVFLRRTNEPCIHHSQTFDTSLTRHTLCRKWYGADDGTTRSSLDAALLVDLRGKPNSDHSCLQACIQYNRVGAIVFTLAAVASIPSSKFQNQGDLRGILRLQAVNVGRGNTIRPHSYPRSSSPSTKEREIEREGSSTRSEWKL
jgi:hypothetical protein